MKNSRYSPEHIAIGLHQADEGTPVAGACRKMGISEQTLHVFDRFYLTNWSRSPGMGGTVLGLAITQAVVEAHGGTVAVESDGPEQGVTVTFGLPRSE